MLHKTNAVPDEAEIFRTWWTGKPLEQADNIRREIIEEMQWDRNKWHRMLHGKTPFTPAEKIALQKIAGERIWP